jgi:hypothetical protein
MREEERELGRMLCTRHGSIVSVRVQATLDSFFCLWFGSHWLEAAFQFHEIEEKKNNQSISSKQTRKFPLQIQQDAYASI